MKVCVVGLGSMGNRRIRSIRIYDQDIIIIGIDKNRQRCLVVEEIGIQTYDDLEKAFSENVFDCAFICSSPKTHGSIITRCLQEGINVFSEINLIEDRYEDNLMLAKEKNLVLFLSSTFLYRNEINEIIRLTKEANCILNYTYHVGQYLPDWHPWENLEDYFISDKETNGIRELLAIELPWLIKTFGEVTDFKIIKKNISRLKINYPDSYLMILEHENNHCGTLVIDLVSRKATRNFEVFGEYIFLEWKGTPESLVIYNYKEKSETRIKLYDYVERSKYYNESIVENAYYNEVDSFFNIVSNPQINTMIYDFKKDKSVLRLIDRMERK